MFKNKTTQQKIQRMKKRPTDKTSDGGNKARAAFEKVSFNFIPNADGPQPNYRLTKAKDHKTENFILCAFVFVSKDFCF